MHPEQHTVSGPPKRTGHALAALTTMTALLWPMHVSAAPRMSTTPVAQILGDQSLSGFGEASVTAGDVNNDGFSDLIVGASTYANGQINEGQVRFYFGSANGIATTAAVIWESDDASALFGRSVTCLGDVTGDGTDDIAFGAPNYGASDDGAVFFYKGSVSGPSPGANRTILGDTNSGGLGGSISDAGDVNNDGFQDLLVGGSLFANGQANEGRALVYLAAGGTMSTEPVWEVEGNSVGARFGSTVAGAGDVNGDGFDDVLVGAFRFTNGESSEGKAFLYLSSASGIATTPAWQLEGNQASANLSISLAGAGDVNGDGFSDFLVGASGYDNGNTNEGRVYLFLGSSGTISTTPARTYEGNEDNARFGASVGTAGDVNGDGFADFVIGATGAAAGGVARGKVQLYLGSGSSPPSSPTFTYNGTQDSGAFGAQAITAGDVNGDGFSDLVISATSHDGNVTDGGAVFLYYGAAAPPQTNPHWGVSGQNDGDLYGTAVQIVGDINADGFDDALVSAPSEGVPTVRDGVVYLYKGSEAGLQATSAFSFHSPSMQSGKGWGSRLARAGDVNADGFDDFLIADYTDPLVDGTGTVQLFKGGSGTPLVLKTWAGEPNEFLGQSMASGDFDGDGFFDVVLPGFAYAGDFVDGGRVRVLNGGPSGPDDLPDWELRGKSASLFVGVFVSRAGDVNADGYDDLLVSQNNTAGDTSSRGFVSLYLGSFCGLESTPSWTRSGVFGLDAYGYRTTGCGDVNGDGFGDVAIVATKADNGLALGRIEVFHGDPSGLETEPAFTANGTASDNFFGRGISTAGDLNLDGFSDLVVGTPNYDSGAGGRAFVYFGSPTGLEETSGWATAPDTREDWFGESVSGGGDVNADGYSDFIVGVPKAEVGEFNFLGAASAYLGNDGVAVDRNLLQLATAGGPHVTTGARNPAVTETIAMRSFLRSACGRSNVRLQVDRRATGTSFGAPTHNGPVFIDTGAPVAGEGSAITDTQTLVSFSTGISYHWRYRAECVNPYFPHTPWMSPQGNSPSEADVRMRPVTSDVRDVLVRNTLLLGAPIPNPTAAMLDIEFSLLTPGTVRLTLHDATGRLVRELLAGPMPSGIHRARWDGRNASGAEVSSGVYFARVNAGKHSATRKVIVQR